MRGVLLGMHRAGLALLVLAAFLTACAQLAPEPPIPTQPTAAPRPTIVEVDLPDTPIAQPTPPPTPAARGACPASFAALDPVDQAMFGDLALIQDTFVHRRFVIWDGKYRFDDIPMVLARRDRSGTIPGYGFLVYHPDGTDLANAGLFQPPTFFDLGTVYCISPLPDDRALAAATSLPYLPLHTGLAPITSPRQVDDQTRDDFAFLLIYGDRSKEPRAAERTADPRAADQWTSHAVREAFHRWQTSEGYLDKQYRPAGGDASVPGDPLTKEQVALALLEQRILAAALQTAATDDRLIRQFVAVRQLRLALYPAATQAEQAQEQRDGTAGYVAYRFATASGQVQLQPWRERLLAGYAGDSASEADAASLPIAHYMQQERPALTGAALGLLMDAAAIPWRPLMAEGKTPFDLLAAAIPVDDGEREALTRQAKARFAYAELEARAEATLEHR